MMLRNDSLLAFPDTIEARSTYCFQMSTDHATVVTSVYFATHTKRIVDYLGCSGVPLNDSLKYFTFRGLELGREYARPPREHRDKLKPLRDFEGWIMQEAGIH
jgi:hypothetical protein